MEYNRAVQVHRCAKVLHQQCVRKYSHCSQTMGKTYPVPLAGPCHCRALCVLRVVSLQPSLPADELSLISEHCAVPSPAQVSLSCSSRLCHPQRWAPSFGLARTREKRGRGVFFAFPNGCFDVWIFLRCSRAAERMKIFRWGERGMRKSRINSDGWKLGCCGHNITRETEK